MWTYYSFLGFVGFFGFITLIIIWETFNNLLTCKKYNLYPSYIWYQKRPFYEDRRYWIMKPIRRIWRITEYWYLHPISYQEWEKFCEKNLKEVENDWIKSRGHLNDLGIYYQNDDDDDKSSNSHNLQKILEQSTKQHQPYNWQNFNYNMHWVDNLWLNIKYGLIKLIYG